MPLIGKPCKPKQINYRWPNEKELVELDLHEPLTLTAVNSKGVERSELTGIQLEFLNGLKSRFIDAKHPYVKDVQNFAVANKAVKRVVARVFSGVCITKLELMFEEGGS